MIALSLIIVLALSLLVIGIATVALALCRWPKPEVRDYSSLLHLSSSYAVSETQVQPENWVADKNPSEPDLPGEGVLVLGIQRADGTYVGAPTGKTRLYEKDTIILYGRQEALAELDRRQAGLTGNNAQEKAVAKQQILVKEQSKQEQEQEKKRKLERD